MSEDIRKMIYKVKNFVQFLNENTNNILNKSFNYTYQSLLLLLFFIGFNQYAKLKHLNKIKY